MFRTRPLGHLAMPYVYLDATYIKARNNHRVVSRAVVVATAVTVDGNREILGVDVGDSEDEVFWTAFLRVRRHDSSDASTGVATPKMPGRRY